MKIRRSGFPSIRRRCLISVRTRPGPPEGTFASRNYSFGLPTQVISETSPRHHRGNSSTKNSNRRGFGKSMPECSTSPHRIILRSVRRKQPGYGKAEKRIDITPFVASHRRSMASTESLSRMSSYYLLLFNGTSSFASIGGEFTFSRTIAAWATRLAPKGESSAPASASGMACSTLTTRMPSCGRAGKHATISVGVRF